eukprot:3245892-Rhodomonas_salina.2
MNSCPHTPRVWRTWRETSLIVQRERGMRLPMRDSTSLKCVFWNQVKAFFTRFASDAAQQRSPTMKHLCPPSPPSAPPRGFCYQYVAVALVPVLMYYDSDLATHDNASPTNCTSQIPNLVPFPGEVTAEFVPCNLGRYTLVMAVRGHRTRFRPEPPEACRKGPNSGNTARAGPQNSGPAGLKAGSPERGGRDSDSVTLTRSLINENL